MNETVEIAELGAQGDGVARADTGPLYVPFALPGETVEVERQGRRAVIRRVLEPSPDRVKPACRHFGVCGGCSLQHLDSEAYRRFKHDKVAKALRTAGIAVEPESLIACAPQTRRRAVFSARNTASGPVFGFNRMQSREIIDIGECPVLVPAIALALPLLRSLTEALGKTRQAARLAVIATEAGLDIDISGVEPTEDLRQALLNFAIARGIARIALDGEIVVEPVRPVVRFDGIAATPPPGGFLQATVRGEDAMADLVTEHLADARRVIDLFAGSGTFALRLARSALVHAVESDAAALAELDRAFRFAVNLKTVTAERRDLFRRPVAAAELKRFDGLVFDPPRAGAEAQATQIAKSDVARVAAVSCNPVTLARDLSILVDGGYTVTSVTPIDQFLWSPHVEVVALLEKSGG